MYISCVQKDILINAIVNLLYILVLGQLTVNPAPRLATMNCALAAAATARIAASALEPKPRHGPTTEMPSFARKIITNCNNFN